VCLTVSFTIPRVNVFWHPLNRRLGGPHNRITRHNFFHLALQFDSACSHIGARSGAVGSGTALQAGRSRVQWCHWNFSLTWSFRPHYGPGFDSASNRKEYQEYFLGGKGGQCVGLTILPPSPIVMKSGSLNFLEPSEHAQSCIGIALPILLNCNFYLIVVFTE
jgi:hypothetical protein